MKWSHIQNRDGRDWVPKSEADEKVTAVTQQLVNAHQALGGLLDATSPAGPGRPQDPVHLLQDAMMVVGMILPKDHVFFLMATPKDAPKGRLQYGGPMEQQFVLDRMTEFLIQNNRDPDGWGKHRV